jgi:hypothetical protein
MKDLVVMILKKNEDSILELEKKIEKGGNKKSIESVICGIRKNNEILKLINDLLNGKNGDEKIIKRLEYCRKVELKEISKEDVIKNDLLDVVIIKKINGVNKYFISE